VVSLSTGSRAQLAVNGIVRQSVTVPQQAAAQARPVIQRLAQGQRQPGPGPGPLEQAPPRVQVQVQVQPPEPEPPGLQPVLAAEAETAMWSPGAQHGSL